MDAPQVMTPVLHSMLAATPTLALALAGGCALGLLHFASLQAALTQYGNGRIMLGLALHAGRMVVLVGALYGLVRLGAGPLLAGAAGLLIGRTIVMRMTR